MYYFIDSLLTLPLLYAIISTLIEFRFNKKKSITIIVFAIGMTLLIDFWMYLNGATIANLYSYAWITTCIPSFLSLLYLAKYRDGSFFFVFLTECVLASIVTILANLFAYFVPLKFEFIPVLIHIILLICILIICRVRFRGNFFEAARIQGKKWYIYCILPIMCIIVWCLYNSLSNRFSDIANCINLPYAGYINPHFIPIFIFLPVMVFYAVSLIFIIIIEAYHAEAERREKMFLRFQSKTLESQLSIMKDKEKSMYILRHDFRHHLNTLSGLLQSGTISRAQDYISQLDCNLRKIKQERYCENSIINAIISFYADICQKEGIEFIAQVQISEHIALDDIDIGAVLSNLLENAKNACIDQTSIQKKFMDVKFIHHNKQFVLDISNSFSGSVEFSDHGYPVSTKEEHGIGSQSIYAFARKYDACLDYITKNGVFNIRMMFTEKESI